MQSFIRQPKLLLSTYQGSRTHKRLEHRRSFMGRNRVSQLNVFWRSTASCPTEPSATFSQASLERCFMMLAQQRHSRPTFTLCSAFGFSVLKTLANIGQYRKKPQFCPVSQKHTSEKTDKATFLIFCLTKP